MHGYLYSDHTSCPSTASAMLRSALILPSTQRHHSLGGNLSLERLGQSPAIVPLPLAAPLPTHAADSRCGFNPSAPTSRGGKPHGSEQAVEMETRPPRKASIQDLHGFLENHEAYQILGVTRTSPPSEVEKAYPKLCLQHHPDKWSHKSDCRG